MLKQPPPKLAPKPGKVKVYRALYKYEAQYQDELSFDEGELIYVTDQSSNDWWKATCGKKSGLVPSNYVGEHAEEVDNPLHEGAKRGNLSFMQECLSNHVSVNGLDKSGSTPLHWACNGGHLDCVRLLLANRCQLDVQNKLGDTPLHSAAWKGHAEVVELLLNAGASNNIRNCEKKLPYDLSAKSPSVSRLLKQSVQRSGSRIEDYGDADDSD